MVGRIAPFSRSLSTIALGTQRHPGTSCGSVCALANESSLISTSSATYTEPAAPQTIGQPSSACTFWMVCTVMGSDAMLSAATSTPSQHTIPMATVTQPVNREAVANSG